MAGEQPQHDPKLHEYLASNNAPCDWCGYNLRGTTGAKCPECGGPLDLEFVMNPPSQQRDLDRTPGLDTENSRSITRNELVLLLVLGLIFGTLFVLFVAWDKGWIG